MTNLQVIRRVLPCKPGRFHCLMFSNLLISLVKASALASMVSVVDVFAAAKITAQQNYRFLAYVAVAIIYWLISLVIEKGALLLENRLLRKLRRAAL